MRLDRACAEHCDGVSRNQIQRANRDGAISVDDRVRPDSYTLCRGQRGAVSLAALAPRGTPSSPRGQALDVPVVVVDVEISVLHKPAGRRDHPD